ncbi:MAG: type II and III secretion system protein family protein [Alphaproteobacteria bacterium]|nr:type II and III secretion system protein family protein [Alphaproteobacteria bacterium]
MAMSSFFKAGLLGLAIGVQSVQPSFGQDILKVMRGSASSSINVSMNRAVVMESDVPFAELSVANPAIADIATLSDRTIYVLGKSPGRTTLTLLGPDGRLITNVDVRVSPDIAEFKERLREILPSEQIEVRTANDGIVLSGRISGKRKLALAIELGERYAPGRVTNLMTVGGTQQVMLKVRFAEMQRSVTKSLSSSLGLSATGGSITGEGGNGTFVNGVNPTTYVDGLPSDAVTPHTPSNAQGAVGIGFSAGGIQMSLLLEALESQGLVRTLAEPNLVAISGQSASFLAGGEYPIPVESSTGITVQYKPFGVELNFTPVVVDGDLINLTIQAAVSSIDTTVSVDTGTIAVSGFKRRETSTTVEMRDGQSFAIAGLLQDDFTDLAGQVPWLGDIPVLGALFRSSEYARKQSELVIIVTPHLVTPVKGDSLTLPTDRIRIPSESELFLLGKVAGKTGSDKVISDIATQDLNGSFGYVME